MARRQAKPHQNASPMPVCQHWRATLCLFCAGEHDLTQGFDTMRLVCAGLVYRAMGFPPQFFTVLFAVPRVTGYLSHWREQLSDPDVKIARPQQNYTVRLPCLL